MFEAMNRKVSQLTESGLAQRIVDSYRCIKKFTVDSAPQVLTLEHLSAGFYVWLACIIVGVLSFVLEVCFRKFL